MAEAAHQAFFMFWQTLWALVLGFVLSGLVQAYVSRSKMQAVLGDHGPAAIGRSTFFGVVSSSCSYAAAALAKTLFSRGADFTAAMVFMLASTNLVVELGLVLWLLLGWQFALAEFVGGVVMVVLMAYVLPRVIPARLIDQARTRLNGGQAHGDHAHGAHDHGAAEARGNLRDAASYTIADLTMLRKELVIGFVVAGILAAAVPTSVWQALFLTGHGWVTAVENAIVGPFLAIISFVCSVGNVPLAAALWTGGIGFGGVIAFVFADLITLPLLVIYRKYYGTAITLRLAAALWAIMSVAGLVVEVLFSWWGIVPGRRAGFASMELAWDHTTYLNIVAVILLIVVVVLARTRQESSGYAIDPICGMQVEIAHAPAVRQGPDGAVYFCADRCADRWDKGQGPAPMAPAAVVPEQPLLQIGLRPPTEREDHGHHV
ncbi:permease [Nocardioides baekrokdamisoli]|nr:permease [Nocardioides baekrokdamisoli]